MNNSVPHLLDHPMVTLIYANAKLLKCLFHSASDHIYSETLLIETKGTQPKKKTQEGMVYTKNQRVSVCGKKRYLD